MKSAFTPKFKDLKLRNSNVCQIFYENSFKYISYQV
jgi:hypothetical protein